MAPEHAPDTDDIDPDPDPDPEPEPDPTRPTAGRDLGVDLGGFLRSRRARLRPEDVGLRDYGGRRRVPGLRREEIAQLAGVSNAYYTRLEQGQSRNASDAVLDAVARALRLDVLEHNHLLTLARPCRLGGCTTPRPERLRPTTQYLMDAMPDVPAFVSGRRTDILGWNRLGHTLIAGHLPYSAPERAATRPNLARMIFLDAHTREFHSDWAGKTRESVSYLRLIAGRHQNDARLAELIGELTMKSPEFAALWAKHPVADCHSGSHDYHHPLVGPLTLHQQILELTPETDQRLILLNAVPGTPSEAALRLLAGYPEPVLSDGCTSLR